MHLHRSRRRPPASRARISTAVATLSLLPLVGACGGLSGSDPDPAPDRDLYGEAVRAMEAGDYAEAEERFRRLAVRCETGDDGRSALLALTTLNLDLRNSAGRPAEAARLAAIHLNLPEAPAAERSLARTLYLLAVYRGAEPVEGPGDLDWRPPPAETSDSSASGVGVEFVSNGAADASDTAVETRTNDEVTPFEPARRFSDCGTDGPVAWRGVPDYPGTPPSRWTEGDTVLVRDPGVAGRAAALQARVNELEAELERIRKVLKSGGGEVPKLRP